ncbi:MAG: MinD/ParA family protein [Pseudomonadota bacterium]
MSTPNSLRIIAVTSGKGGVGKTNVAVNLAVRLGSAGRKVMLFDADLGLANVDIALGLKPEHSVEQVLNGSCSLQDVLIEGPAGVLIIPAASGVAELADLSPQQHAGLVHAFSELPVPLDTLIVDTAAGIDSSVLTFSAACQEIIIVVCDEPTSITDAYALIKVLHQKHAIQRFQIISNMVDHERAGSKLFEKLCRVADQFLEIQLGYLGYIPRDEYLRRAVRQQEPVVTAFPRSASARAFADVCRQLSATASTPQVGGLSFFMERLMSHPGGSA